MAENEQKVDKMFHPGNKKILPVIPNKHKRWCIPFFKTEIAFTKTLRLMNRLKVKKSHKIIVRNRKTKVKE